MRNSMKMRRSNFYIFFLLLPLYACQQLGFNDPAIDELPAVVDGFLQAVIEIPAGTNHKIEYDYGEGEFLLDQENGHDRIIKFLPYPGNYGFVPGTLMDKERGGDGDALDVLVIGETVATGTVLSVKPLGALVLKDRGEIDTKLIAIPALPQALNLGVENFLDFAVEYDAARRIIEDWFVNYKGAGKVEFLRWEDETFAWQEVEKWTKQ